MEILIKLFGTFDENIKAICDSFNVKVVMLDGGNAIQGEAEDVENAMKVIDKLTECIVDGQSVDIGRVKYLCDCVKDGTIEEVDQLLHDVVAITNRGKPIRSKTVGQRKYVDYIRKKTITFGIGPAGTGKTYLAVAMAVNGFKSKQVEKIILTRPAVEAGEKLGFLPGDLQEMLGLDSYSKLMEKGVIEIAPLAYMRGRTLNNAFIILDEAQNTTKEQIKMFLTRLGENSKMVITGDLTQIDLPEGKISGLKHATRILQGIDEIGIMRFSEKDVVRHPLVQLIVKAYETHEEKR